MDADVIVIGAGAAGLAAARSLARRSLRTLVLEARDRAGGRVLQASSGSALTAELGAEFVHGPAPETYALLRECGGSAIDTAGDMWAGPGELHRSDEWFAAGELFEDARTLDPDESVEAYLRRFDRDAPTRERAAAARAFVEGFDAADPAIASARAIALELSSGVDSSSTRPLGGYGPIFERLVHACAGAGARLRFSSIVRRVAWRPGAVAIETDTGGRMRTLRARAAIVTLPAAVLRHGDVAFEPALPVQKREALEHVETGHVVKVALWFQSAFWERLRDGAYRDGAFFRGGPNDRFGTFWTQYPVRGDLMIAWAGGPKANALRAGAREAIVDCALRELGALFCEPGLALAEFEAAAMHDWGGDPFARGAYSYLGVGAGDARLDLAAPVDGTLFFAGEATANDGQGGTVNGAFATGERAALEAASALGV